MLEFIGYLGSLLLSLCAFPEVYTTIKNKKCNISDGMLLMWISGEMCLLFYVLPNSDVPLVLNYLTNIILAGILIYYKVYPGEIE